MQNFRIFTSILLNLQSRKLTFDHQPQRVCKLNLTYKIRSWVSKTFESVRSFQFSPFANRINAKVCLESLGKLIFRESYGHLLLMVVFSESSGYKTQTERVKDVQETSYLRRVSRGEQLQLTTTRRISVKWKHTNTLSPCNNKLNIYCLHLMTKYSL